MASLIHKHNKLYHQKDRPEITDKDFDKLVKENYELERKFPHLILKNSPNKFVGGRPSKNLKKLLTNYQCFHYQMLLIKTML